MSQYHLLWHDCPLTDRESKAATMAEVDLIKILTVSRKPTLRAQFYFDC